MTHDPKCGVANHDYFVCNENIVMFLPLLLYSVYILLSR